MSSWIDGDLIAKILAANGLVGTVWKECNESWTSLPELAIAMVDYNSNWEVGRCVLFHRMKMPNGKTEEYVIDPYPHDNSLLHLRVGAVEIAKLKPSWFVGITQMQQIAAAQSQKTGTK